MQLAPVHMNRHTVSGLQLKVHTNSKSLLAYERSIVGHAPNVWERLPQELISKGSAEGWQSITKECQRFLTGTVKGQTRITKFESIMISEMIKLINQLLTLKVT